MEIPASGAIFTLGKSYLAENTQSYFYIKNDAIRRLIAGPYQSAVICETGRLFVWGENQYGQLAINATNKKNDNNNVEQIIVKPTCVKYLKTLQLKATDMAFGDDWSVILTHTNGIYFSGRNIFTTPNSTDGHLVTATVNGQTCQLAQQPIRLSEFDAQLMVNVGSDSTGITENYVKILAGSEHFVVLTSLGRLIGWGSNDSHQLGVANRSTPVAKPHEIVLDAPVEQFACGPESTLVLTEKSSLYLTGRLNEFIFPQFTELQKNLSNNEAITFMHISKSNEIFIVTNKGSIYRSFESIRNKSLIFQRFYDYDSEENDNIWKLLKGDAFCAVLTTTQKFYTTFSESGHHLKTFREISKFKNLRLLNMALGVQHILVHGVPRSTALANILVTTEEAGLGAAAAVELAQAEGLRKLKPLHHNNISTVLNTPVQKDANKNVLNNDKESDASEAFDDNKSNLDETSSTATPLSFRSVYSVQQEQNANDNSNPISADNEKRLRPRTPYPEQSSELSNSQEFTRTAPLPNGSYETAVNGDHNNNAELQLESLSSDSAPSKQPGVKISTPTPPPEEDEELMLEISQTTDPLDHTLILNEIRFINNGIDVTASVKKQRYSTDSQANDEPNVESNGNENETNNPLVNGRVEMSDNNDHTDQCAPGKKTEQIKDTTQTQINASQNVVDEHSAEPSMPAELKAENEGSNSLDALKRLDSTKEPAVDDVKTSVSHTLRKVADDTLHVVQSVTSKISMDMLDAKTAISSILPSKKNKVDTERNLPAYDKVVTEATEHSPANGTEDNSSNIKQQQKSNTLNTSGAEDDERTTASVNSTHTNANNPDDDNHQIFDNEQQQPNCNNSPNEEKNNLDDGHMDGYSPDRHQQYGSSNAVNEQNQNAGIEDKSKLCKFMNGIRQKTKQISCRNEKSLRIDDDQPPRYTEADELAERQIKDNEHSSKVCNIL